MIGIRVLSGIVRTASKIVPLAVQSSVYLSHHVTPSVKANDSGKLLYRLFSPSRGYSTRLISPESFLRGMGPQEEEEEEEVVVEDRQAIQFKVEERPDQQSLVLTSVLTKELLSKELGGKISNVEVHLPDAVICEQDDDNDNTHNSGEAKANQSSIPFVLKASSDIGVCLEICCTCFLDQICFDRTSVVKDPLVSYDQIDLYMTENLLKTYLMHRIKPSTIYHLLELKLELNQFKKSFFKLSQEFSDWSILSAVFDYSCRRHFDSKLIHPAVYLTPISDDDFKLIHPSDWDNSDDELGEVLQMQKIAGKLIRGDGRFNLRHSHRSELIFVLTREYKEETICIELLHESISNFDEAGKQFVVPFIFSLSNINGVCLEFHCAAYPGKISLDVLHVIEGKRPMDLVATGDGLLGDFEGLKRITLKRCCT